MFTLLKRYPCIHECVPLKCCSRRSSSNTGKYPLHVPKCKRLGVGLKVVVTPAVTEGWAGLCTTATRTKPKPRSQHFCKGLGTSKLEAVRTGSTRQSQSGSRKGRRTPVHRFKSTASARIQCVRSCHGSCACGPCLRTAQAS